MRSGTRVGHCRTSALAIAVGLLALAAPCTPAQADTIRSRQWHLDAMHAEEMWQVSTGKGVTVAVIDTGVDRTLPDLAGQVVGGRDFAQEPGDAYTDNFKHGTGIAVLIAGTGKRGDDNASFGLAPGAKIISLRVPDGTEANSQAQGVRNFSSAVSKAIRYAADGDAKIINISMGQSEDSPEIADAVRYAMSKGKLIFAGVGNSGEKGNPVQYPAATPGVVGVAAVDKDSQATRESERGPQVDLAAPGDEMVAACAGGTELCKSHGTSDATALASASAALIWSVHPEWTANQVTRVLINTAGAPQSGERRSDSIGYGIVRPRIALQNPGDPGPADVNPLPGPPAGAAAPEPGARSGGAPQKTAADRPSRSGTTTWVVIGGAAAVVIAAAVGVPVLMDRRRRNRT
ncbi:type VII secretion-associated serine protease mycosin [Streptomyces sp. NPDC049577]|uniref:type VII secretion-associated serine protease mycosin n=1 Tax=Streptomyces sp. NPDC049577 TaxID=3155153 RepID=UPI00343AA851